MADNNSQAEHLTLHGMHASGNSYKIRLVAALLGAHVDRIDYDTRNGETRTKDFTTRINANGRVPVLQIGSDIFLPESNAACYYIASNPYLESRQSLIPKHRLEHAQMLQWMFFEQYQHEPALAVLRFWKLLVGEPNLTEAQRAQIPAKEAQAREALDVMDGHLAGREWFVGRNISLADICLYAYTHEANEFGFDLAKWANVRRWCARVAGLKGYITIEDRVSASMA